MIRPKELRITFKRVTVLLSLIFIFCQIWLLILHVYYNKVSASGSSEPLVFKIFHFDI